ncbi:MAG: SDR family oxidoreductase [Paenibacillaceae bacterium]
MKGKKIFITGAASGIGKATAIAFADMEAELILNDLPQSFQNSNVVYEVEKRGARCSVRAGDVSSSESVMDMFHGLDSVDVLVNNAGFLEEISVIDMSDEQWDRMIKVMLYGTFYCSREAVKLMQKQKGRKIINIASDLGQLGCEKLCHYAAAKGGIIAFTKSLARELGPDGICVNAVAPGGTMTPLVERLGAQYILEEAEKYPMKRLGQAEEIASVIVFLASEKASFMTGQIIGVNGGSAMYG